MPHDPQTPPDRTPVPLHTASLAALGYPTLDDLPTLELAPAAPPPQPPAPGLNVSADIAELDEILAQDHAARLRSLRQRLLQHADEGVPASVLDAEAARQLTAERSKVFEAELLARIIPDPDTITLARQLDTLALRVWADAALSLAHELPASLLRFRAQHQEQWRVEWRIRAGFIRLEAATGQRLRQRYGGVLGLLRRTLEPNLAAAGRRELAGWQRAAAAAAHRMARQHAIVAAIDARDAARDAWFAHYHDVLARGVAALFALDEHEHAERQDTVEVASA